MFTQQLERFLEGKKVTRLLLIRHGLSTWNVAGRIQGQADPPLDDIGREQAHKLARRLLEDQPNVLYTSPLRRAMETAEIIGNKLSVPVVIDDRLKEYGVGEIMGLTWQQVVEQYPDLARQWEEASEDVKFPDAEGSGVFRTRVSAAFAELLTQHPDETIGVVAHGGVLGAYLNDLIGLPSRFSPFRFANSSLSIVEVNAVRPRVTLLNDTCHLRGEI